MVPGAGVEPASLAAAGFKPAAFTSFATRATPASLHAAVLGSAAAALIILPPPCRPHERMAGVRPSSGPFPVDTLNALRLMPVFIALAILAAHFYRAHAWVPFGIAIALLPLLFARAPWAARVLQAALAIGALEWLRTAAALVALRQSMGLPYTRLAIILGFVAVGTGLAAFIFQARPVRARFGFPAAGTKP